MIGWFRTFWRGLCIATSISLFIIMLLWESYCLDYSREVTGWFEICFHYVASLKNRDLNIPWWLFTVWSNHRCSQDWVTEHNPKQSRHWPLLESYIILTQWFRLQWVSANAIESIEIYAGHNFIDYQGLSRVLSIPRLIVSVVTKVDRKFPRFRKAMVPSNFGRNVLGPTKPNHLDRCVR